MPELLEVERVSKAFKGIVAVKSLSFELEDGEILGLIGPNGAGKTTAFNMIAGVYPPDTGVVKFSGREISGKKPHAISQQGIARTFQIVKPFPRMTTLENAMVGSLFGRNHSLSVGSAKSSALESLEYVGLTAKAELPAAQLTLAEQRRLELARALSSNPKLLMLDEIMAGLNNTEISQTIDLLKKLNQQKHVSLLVIEHVMMAIMSLCSNIIVMDHGEKIAEGAPQEIASNIQVIEAYMGKARFPRASKSEIRQ